MFASKQRESRRKRSFIGSECATCEEPLEHILRAFCGHVSHEACFYEYIKEFKAGGGIDFENLSKAICSAQAPDPSERFRDQSTPTAREPDHFRQSQQTNQSSPRRVQPMQRYTREHLVPTETLADNYRYNGVHGRNQSGDTGVVSTADYAETHHTAGRRHDYDVQSIETTLSSPRHTTRNPIPAPTVTVRSEFPTLSKSRHQQSLACLVTVEVVDEKWQPNPDDLRNPPTVPATIPEHVYQYSKPEPKSRTNGEQHRPMDSVHEDTQALERVK
ncbi:hypothetical protein LTR37_021194 [Vermiconidia calcicola]|uniref:Uncharacterized protein n=1 Tax=Vermiconidia calcicola TaxID=1690605 RepID=A0ACC3M9G0_9PEZI|nr:hypothetical protein LTR37_021194 [Vermiconidia calcicola]